MRTTNLLPGLILAFLFISTHSISAQTALNDAPRRADLQPAWPGCDQKIPDCTKSRLTDFIAANVQIPAEAKAENAGGVVAMEFVIEKTGLIGEIRPMRDPGLGLGAEATRVIELMKSRKMKWTPAENGGKKIPFRMVFPVSFNLPAPPKEKPEVKMAPLPADGIYEIVEVMPRYAGCEESNQDTVDCTFREMLSHIKSNLKYPEEALKQKVHGQVVIGFIVDKDGTVTKPSLIKGIGAGCDEEAMRVVSTMPAWTPGMQNGVPVPVRMKVPFFFQLPKID